MTVVETVAEPRAGLMLSTPALIVELDIFMRNVQEMATLLHGTGKTVRPHVKTTGRRSSPNASLANPHRASRAPRSARPK